MLGLAISDRALALIAGTHRGGSSVQRGTASIRDRESVYALTSEWPLLMDYVVYLNLLL